MPGALAHQAEWEAAEFETSLDYTVRSHLKHKMKPTRQCQMTVLLTDFIACLVSPSPP